MNMPSLENYINYIYTFLLSFAGIIALVSLILGGILYLTSAGTPEKLEEAKKQILAAFLGIIILFSSYLILKTINPELTKLELPNLTKIIFNTWQLPSPTTNVPKLLSKIKEIADQSKLISEEIENLARDIKNLTDNCDCKNTQPLCVCTGGTGSDSCNPRRCYADSNPHLHPCPDFEKIKDDQENIIAFRSEILYYKNRALAEIEDLNDGIEEVLKKEMKNYQDRLKEETEEEAINYFNEQISNTEQEITLKQTLTAELNNLVDLIEKANSST